MNASLGICSERETKRCAGLLLLLLPVEELLLDGLDVELELEYQRYVTYSTAIARKICSSSILMKSIGGNRYTHACIVAKHISKESSFTTRSRLHRGEFSFMMHGNGLESQDKCRSVGT